MSTFDSSSGKSSSKGSNYGYSSTRSSSTTQGWSTGYREGTGHIDCRGASEPLHLHDGFWVDRGGLTYIGPVEDFPERYLRQALCGLEQSKGTAGLIAFLEDYVAVLQLKRGRK